MDEDDFTLSLLGKCLEKNGTEVSISKKKMKNSKI